MGGPCLVDGVAREELDNFLPCHFVTADGPWTSAEHCFQGGKFPHNKAYKEKIRQAASGGDAHTLANVRTMKIRVDWERIKVQCMYEANLAKFVQNPDLRAALVSTQGPITAFGFPFWAKWNAVLLERIREELRPASERNETTLASRVAAMDAYAAGQDSTSGGKSFGGTGKACAASGGIPFAHELLQALPVRGAEPLSQSAGCLLVTATGCRPREAMPVQVGGETAQSSASMMPSFCLGSLRAWLGYAITPV